MRNWDNKPEIKIKLLNPKLLGQANVPKPLHGINPRTIMGATAWKNVRSVSLRTTPYCTACGKETPFLDLHEDYNIDYKKGIMSLNQYVTLCRDCHQFIHSGLLLNFMAQKKISVPEGKRILKHGLAICKEHNVKVFSGTFNLANKLKIDTKGIQAWKPPSSRVPWENWRLVFNNKTHYGLSRNAWLAKYGSDA